MDWGRFDFWTRRRFGLGAGATAASLVGMALGAEAAKGKKKKKKKPPKPDAVGSLARSGAAVNANCIPDAKGTIKLFRLDGVEKMEVSVSGLPPRKNYDVFVIQDPDANFGLTWYQGDLKTDGSGNGTQTFIGRFSIETFIVAPGVEPAPVVHNDPPFPDANDNPVTGPVHTFHVGLWFDSPEDAEAADCPNTETPFNGDHTAGVQALTSVAKNGLGPLAQID
ncbi:MAG: hypothetical protein U0031_10020 [Thermomicrobiales bacterium]